MKENQAFPEERHLHWLGGAFNVAAAAKVGTTSRQRLQWLASNLAQGRDYAATDFAESSLEIALFVLFESGPGTVNLGVPPPLSARRVGELAREVREKLHSFVDGKTWELEVNERVIRRLSRTVREMSPNKGKLEVRSTWNAKNLDYQAFRLLFLLAVQDLLVREGQSLARCQATTKGEADEYHKCMQLFVQDDPRQKFCSDSHAHADRQYRYRTGRTVGETK